MLKNASFLAIVAVDTDENEPSKVSMKWRVPKRSCTRHVRQHGKEWRPRLFLELCQDAQGIDREGAQFCRAVMNLEWRLLLDHVLAKV